MIVRVLAALAEPTRIEVMHLLSAHGEMCACELVPRLEATQSRVSRHLQMLKQAGLVIDRRDAQRVLYRIDPELAPAIRAVLDTVLSAYASAERRAA